MYYVWYNDILRIDTAPTLFSFLKPTLFVARLGIVVYDIYSLTQVKQPFGKKANHFTW